MNESSLGYPHHFLGEKRLYQISLGALCNCKQLMQEPYEIMFITLLVNITLLKLSLLVDITLEKLSLLYAILWLVINLHIYCM